MPREVVVRQWSQWTDSELKKRELRWSQSFGQLEG